MQNRPKLLVVEDSEPQRANLALIMANPPSEWTKGTGATGFHVDTAATAAEARRRIETAQQEKRPYEVVLLDLELPFSEEDVKLDQEHGRSLLTRIRVATNAGVVILTAHPETRNFVHAIREGAIDFVSKPLQTREDEKMLFTRLLSAVGKTRETLYRELRTERLLRLKDHDTKSGRERLAKLISEKMGRISDEVGQLGELLSRRFGLDPRHDADEPVCRRLHGIREAGDELLEMVWKSVEEKEAASTERVDVGTIMHGEITKARPCFFHRDVLLRWSPPNEGELQTVTFRDDLCWMVDEMILGTLELSPPKQTVEFSSVGSADGKDIIVSSARSGEPVPEEVRESLRTGDWVNRPVASTWQGLCFLKRLANNMGVRLDIESNGDRQVVALRIPVIDK